MFWAAIYNGSDALRFWTVDGKKPWYIWDVYGEIYVVVLLEVSGWIEGLKKAGKEHVLQVPWPETVILFYYQKDEPVHELICQVLLHNNLPVE